MKHSSGKIYEFGEFRLDTSEQELRRGAEKITLTPKAVELLNLLIERRGQIISRDEIQEKLWRDTYVDENNLSVTISMLRRAFGVKASEKNFIETVSKRGYRFVADVAETNAELIVERQTRTHIKIQTIEDEKSNEAKPLAAPKSVSARFLLIASAFCLVLVAAGAIFYFSRGANPKMHNYAAAQASPRAIAVLPLKNLSEEADQSLSVGLTDALITKLGNVRGLVVRPTSAVLSQSPGQTPPEIGERLKVELILEGTFQKDGERLRVSVQLIHATDNQILWAGSFNESAKDLFKFQDAFTAEISEKMRLNLSGEEQARLNHGKTDNAEAYRTYLQALYFYNKNTPADFKRAIELLERATQLDEKFALAHAAKAEVYMIFSESSLTDSPPIEFYKKASDAIEKALVLNPNLAEAQMISGNIQVKYKWNVAEAESSYRRALELNPGLAQAHNFLAWNLIRQSRFTEAESEFRRAAELDPTSLMNVAETGYAAFFAEDYETALREFSQALELNKNFPPARFNIWRALHHSSSYEEALEQMDAVEPIVGKNLPVLLMARARNLAKMGRAREAQEIYNRLVERKQKGEYISPALLANITADINDRDGTFRWLEECIEMREDYVTFLPIAPEYKQFRTDARFIELLDRIKPMN